jgi:hypothetical protein
MRANCDAPPTGNSKFATFGERDDTPHTLLSILHIQWIEREWLARWLARSKRKISRYPLRHNLKRRCRQRLPGCERCKPCREPQRFGYGQAGDAKLVDAASLHAIEAIHAWEPQPKTPHVACVHGDVIPAASQP